MHKLDHARIGLFLGRGGLSIGSITCTWLFEVCFTSAWDALVGRIMAGRVCFFRIFTESLFRIFELFANVGMFYLSLSSV